MDGQHSAATKGWEVKLGDFESMAAIIDEDIAFSSISAIMFYKF